MRKYVYLLVDVETNDVVAIYDDKTLAEKMKDTVEAKFGCKLHIDERSVNLSIDVIGLIK